MNPEQRPEVVQVEQGDREAAEAVYAGLSAQFIANGHKPVRSAPVTPDDDEMVQAFARHRIAADKAALERAAQIADIHAEATDTPDDFTAGYEIAARKIARRIRASHPERRSENG